MSTVTQWGVDPLHSEVQFKVKHLVISTVTGAFNSFSGGAVSKDGSLEGAEVHFTIDVNSIDTNQSQRDEHLRAGDFFDTTNHPQITFKSTSFTKVKGDLYKLVGDLTIKGVTKSVEVDAEYGGTAKDAWGNTKIGFEVTGKINRKEFGLTYNAVTETGGLALGEDIKLIANIQLAEVA
ncbi:YceI family protein [Siphonobacter aquaeclarae]|jgi:polyisoprenoid-binding protein YceI|uniref:Polyisoprenoid-binding protein YceI n=1 Tax=Siphonobacter aquaeclarae TaxID=563176 RepID=A0A1G9HYC9_9BACT|nr:YceI family protein [Siphonobacter aquaeclarae]SDL17969.1 Polyisoprenoid-binding protein YceI [Siphonobacter aquaeclarae]